MTSLVKCAKERHELGDTDREELTGEPYELILDAIPYARLPVEKRSIQIEKNSLKH
jgi:hypothetical protein